MRHDTLTEPQPPDTPDDQSRMKRAGIYLSLLAIQTAGATFLFWVVFPVFQHMVRRSGVPQDLTLRTEISIMVAALLMQGCYWSRYRWVPIWIPLRNAAIGHGLMFASRASFFFGGALFSAIFFRHLPELDALPPLGQATVRGVGVMTILFALFCYSVELERLGRAIEERPAKV
jgi:hypothetical protein